MTSAAVLGAGGVGGFVAAALDRSGADTRVVARPETADVLRATGFAVSSRALAADFTARPPVVTELTEPVDVLIVATKATGLDVALECVPATPGLVIALLNGLDHMAALRERFGPDGVAAGVIGSSRTAPLPGASCRAARWRGSTSPPTTRRCARLCTGSRRSFKAPGCRRGSGRMSPCPVVQARAPQRARLHDQRRRPAARADSQRSEWRAILTGA